MKISIYNVKDQPIGSGGMGEVYLGWDSNGNAVAIKKMRAELTADANLRAFFHKEVNTLMRLEHQSIVKMHASFEENGSLYLVMEFVEGETIEQYVRRKGVFTESEAIRLLSDILPAIGYLHQKGFVHRDIKPSNIMIRPNGKVCLLDFGIVKDMKNSSGYTTNQIVGTDGYMSVEQAEGLSIDHRSDIYSLGCVLYYMLVGDHAIQKQSNDHDTRMTIIKKPFPRAQDFNPNLSDTIQRILDKATDKNMLCRFQSCREFELEFELELSRIVGGVTVVVGEDYGNDMVSVGRESCDIIIPLKKVSRHHLDIIKELCSEGNFYRIRDRSTNGTIVNGEKIHNNEKTWLDPCVEHTTQMPYILLAGEVNLSWNDVMIAFAKKQGVTKPIVTSPPTPKTIPPPTSEKKNITKWIIAVVILILVTITILIVNN